jgi:hypothetical protein
VPRKPQAPRAAQWADEPSYLLLDFLARRLPAGAMAVLGSYRDVDPAPGPSMAALAARTSVLPLTGLSLESVTGLVADVVGDQRADAHPGPQPGKGSSARSAENASAT